MELPTILTLSAAAFIAILVCGFFWYSSRNKTNSDTPAAAINNETVTQTPGDPQQIHTQTSDTFVVPILYPTTPPRPHLPRGTTQIGAQPLNPIGLGSLYPLPRRQCETTITDTSVITEPITDPPPSYDEVMGQSTASTQTVPPYDDKQAQNSNIDR